MVVELGVGGVRCKNNYILESSVSPERLAYEKWSFTIKNDEFKTCSIKLDDDTLYGIFYRNNEEFRTILVQKVFNQVYYEKYNNHRVLTNEKTYQSQLIDLIYNNKFKKTMKNIHLSYV